MKDYTVMVKRYGYITVEADALNQMDGLSISDFDWSDFSDAQIVEEGDKANGK